MKPFAILTLPLAAVASPVVYNTSMPSVTLDYTTVVANAGNSSIGFYKYTNVRFAAVPTGDLRFAKPAWPPVETTVNDGSLAAVDIACDSTEDCLYMDIWVPADSVGKKLPVMVWTYGGGFTGGSKYENTPEGLFNLTTEFILVTYNYRVGLTGIANGPTLLHEGGTSNAALWDVQHAFQWTKKYIGAFGGDPEAITAVGFSAGASQTLFQMTRFAGHAEQLFKQAYVMSPGFVPGAGHHQAEMFWQNVSTAVGCEDGHLTCMRSVDFDTLTTASSDIADTYTYQFQPRVDGDFVADTYEAQFYQSRFNFTGPIVLTHELHEVNTRAWAGVNTTANVSTYLRIFFLSIADDVVQRALELYLEEDYASPGLRFADMKQSFDLTAHNLAAAQALVKGGSEVWGGMVVLGEATHGTDQRYKTYSLVPATATSNGNLTGNSTAGGMPGGGGGMGPDKDVDAATAITLQKYLLSFVLTGDPNTLWPEDKPVWPKYSDSEEGTQLVINSTLTTAADDLNSEQSLFWNAALWY